MLEPTKLSKNIVKYNYFLYTPEDVILRKIHYIIHALNYLPTVNYACVNDKELQFC